MGIIVAKKSTPLDWTEIPKNVNLELSNNQRKALFIILQSGYADTVADFTRKAMTCKVEQLGIFKKKIEEIFKKNS